MERIQLNDNNHQEVIDAAIAVLRSGGIIFFPTETCYGVGVDATNQEAVDKLLQYKSRRKDKPISIAVPDATMAEEYVEVNDVARNMYENFLPGPITVVSKGKHKVADGIESSAGTQGIRIPDYPFIRELVKQYGKPITSTSANESYKKTPYTIEDILDNLSAKKEDLVSLAIDAGRLPKRKPSTVVDTTLENIHIVREGSIELAAPEVYEAHSLEETQQFVEQIYGRVQDSIGKKNIVVLLQGELGAGKTHFTKYFAELLNVTETVVSPTYMICREYAAQAEGKDFTLFHMDSYRMYEPSEIDALRPEQLFAAPNIIVIEWANKVAEYIQQYTEQSVVVTINIESTGESSRRFSYTMAGI